MRLSRFQFTLRRMMIAVALVALGIAGTLWVLKAWLLKVHQPHQFYDTKLATEFLTPHRRGGRDLPFSDRLHEVSLVQLIANPERYHNKAVRVSGFLHVQFEGQGIYLSREDANYLNSRNGLWVSFSSADWSGLGMKPQQFDREHVLIEGVFDKDNHGHKGAWSGAIHNVWRVMEERKYYED